MTYSIITAPRASSLIYGLAKPRSDGVWLIPANVCPAIPLALIQAGVSFEFIDICEHTLCFDPELGLERINDNSRPLVRGVIYVRSYGYSKSAIKDIAILKSSRLGHQLCIIDDRCLCFPILDPEEEEFGLADAAIFSTGYSKIFDLGYGGYGFVFNDLEYLPPRRNGQLVSFDAISKKYKSAIQADRSIYADEKQRLSLPRWVPGGEGPNWSDIKQKLIDNWDSVTLHKKQINDVYWEGLSEFSPLDEDFQNWRFNIQVANPKEVLEAIFAERLFASDHYYPSSRLWGNRTSNVAWEKHQTILNLFNDHHYELNQAEATVNIIRQVAEMLGDH